MEREQIKAGRKEAAAQTNFGDRLRAETETKMKNIKDVAYFDWYSLMMIRSTDRLILNAVSDNGCFACGRMHITVSFN